jgi:HSP20 family protein
MFVQVERYPLLTPGVFELEREIDDLFNGFLGGERADVGPRVDVAENDNEFVLLFELPGVAKEDLKITLQDGAIQVAGERKPAAIPEKATWVRNEIRRGEFIRTLQLPPQVKAGEISAELADGILRVVLPKAEAIRPREISIR